MENKWKFLVFWEFDEKFSEYLEKSRNFLVSKNRILVLLQNRKKFEYFVWRKILPIGKYLKPLFSIKGSTDSELKPTSFFIKLLI